MDRRARQQQKQLRERTRSQPTKQRKKGKRAKNQSQWDSYLLAALVWIWHNHIWFGYALAAFSMVYMFGWLPFLPQHVGLAIVGVTLVYWLAFLIIWRLVYLSRRFVRDIDHVFLGKEPPPPYKDL